MNLSLQIWEEEQGWTSDIVFQHSECFEWLNRWLNLECVTWFHERFVQIWTSEGTRVGVCFWFHTKGSHTNGNSVLTQTLPFVPFVTKSRTVHFQVIMSFSTCEYVNNTWKYISTCYDLKVTTSAHVKNMGS